MDNAIKPPGQGPKISALLMIYNEEDQIRDCLETVKWADEIVVCDSFSTDRTVEICREYTGKIYQRKFDNFGNQKKWIMDKPSCEWVLFVEGDERFSQELADEIRSRLNMNEGYDGYWMPFKNYIFGREIKGKFWSFKKIKLYRNGKGRWQDRRVHSNFILDGRAGELKNAVLHYPYRTIGIYWEKFNRATTFEVDEAIATGKVLKWHDIIKSFAWVPVTFYKHYFLWGEWRSGWQGLAISLLASPYNAVVSIKYLLRKLS